MTRFFYRSYMNGITATANLRKRRTLFFYVSYGILTDEPLRSFATEHGDTATEERKCNAGNHALETC